MRIVLVVPSFPKRSETFVVQLFTELLARRHEVFVACSSLEKANYGGFPRLAARTGIGGRVETRRPIRPRVLAACLFPFVVARVFCKNPGGLLRYLWRSCYRLKGRLPRQLYLDAALIACRPDVIHFQFGALAVGRTYLGELLDAKVVTSFRGHDLDHVGLDSTGFYDQVFAESDGLHFLGAYLKRLARRRGVGPGPVSAVIPPAVDPSFFKPSAGPSRALRDPGRPVRILSVGRLHWAKGYQYALLALRQLRDRRLPFLYRMVGEGPDREAALFLRSQLDLDDSVELCGAADLQEVRSHLEWADIFLQASVQEGFCNAALEAQAMELPVVAADAGGLPDNVEDGVTGLVVPRRDPAALADALFRLADDPRSRRAMGRRGRQRVLQYFSVERQMSAFENFYANLVNSGTREPTRSFAHAAH